MIDINSEYYNELVEVELNNTNFRHYKNLGYDYPKIYDKYKHEFITPYGTKIMVKRKDLPDVFMIGKKFGVTRDTVARFLKHCEQENTL